MLNSVFKKWLLTYVSVALISLLLIAIIIGAALREQTYREAEAGLSSIANQVRQISLEYMDGVLTQKEFLKQVNLLERSSHVRISITGKNFKGNMDELLSIGEKPEVKEWVQRVFDGEHQLVRSSFRTNDQTEMLVVGIPFMYNQRHGAIFLYTPVQNIQALVEQIYVKIFYTTLIVGCMVVAALYVASRRFVRPLAEMKEIALCMARGEFQHRMKVEGRDEIAQLSESMNDMAARLETIELGRRQLISEISHELRTPLTTIRASLQGILDEIVDPEDRRSFLQISLDETKRLGVLVQDLLELSLFEEKQVVMNKERMSLSKLLLQTAEQMKVKAAEHKIKLETEIPCDIVIEADAARIKQVLLNLLHNAIMHNSEGTAVGLRLEVSHETVVITVWDRGRGIEEEKLERLFQRFYKADESRAGQGAGLGLTISKHIIEAHGGAIQVHSTLGKGTQFLVMLPLKS
ncbi:ATP-binding protein [Paenibacillus sp. GD4]|uniref:HAMP domain-containing sensor histidine kinase n=1 Tax=Paenibacillus sp. GD4 TaxID=3068890 RepID=UPI0027965513|nr:ATP-binding protein [Paenibacillus sp. GD4]MDQ1909069.1 ATP-binding protein [Paenibacillus sp. GD4]